MIESFFHTLKTELIHHQTFHSRDEAKQIVFEYIEVFYNRQRLHSANEYIPPLTSSSCKMLLNLVSRIMLTHQFVMAAQWRSMFA